MTKAPNNVGGVVLPKSLFVCCDACGHPFDVVQKRFCDACGLAHGYEPSYILRVSYIFQHFEERHEELDDVPLSLCETSGPAIYCTLCDTCVGVVEDAPTGSL